MFTAVLVATSCAALPGTDRRTGIALPQFGLAHDMLTCSGWRVVTTSPAGGAVPVDAGSWSEEWAAVTDPLSCCWLICCTRCSKQEAPGAPSR